MTKRELKIDAHHVVARLLETYLITNEDDFDSEADRERFRVAMQEIIDYHDNLANPDSSI